MSGALLLLVLVVFLLSNREATLVAFWPFGPLGSAALGAIVLITFALGLLAGLLLHVPFRIRAHRRARLAEKQMAAMRAAQPPPSTLPPTLPPVTIGPPNVPPAR
ncbi:MAG: lipopolysaccharide assembly protein LapA domain-containing protein [Acidiphilium sp.]|nr:lipopolysaccharide assembly protein LapA domain-containing protein [Acidiphilium sp.]MDD4934586.1 lipopolysaccharide assembly protein LapA domain-containing protein [Acidiphilium sp.]